MGNLRKSNFGNEQETLPIFVEQAIEECKGITFNYARFSAPNKKAAKNWLLSIIAEKERFELSIPEGITVFETAAFDHSATSPNVLPMVGAAPQPNEVNGRSG